MKRGLVAVGCPAFEVVALPDGRKANSAIKNGLADIHQPEVVEVGVALDPPRRLAMAYVGLFEGACVAVGSVLAAHAAVAWSTSPEIQNLQAGMSSRQLIGEATGILMARQDISEQEAFEMLRRASQRLNVKLRLVADRVVHPDSSRPDGPTEIPDGW